MSAVLNEDASVLLPYVDIYQMGEQALEGAPIATPDPQSLDWAPAETVSADDLSREEILAGAFGEAR